MNSAACSAAGGAAASTDRRRRTRRAPPRPAGDDPLPGRVADYVGDLLAIAEARFEARLRALEARTLSAPPGPAGG